MALSYTGLSARTPFQITSVDSVRVGVYENRQPVADPIIAFPDSAGRFSASLSAPVGSALVVGVSAIGTAIDSTTEQLLAGTLFLGESAPFELSATVVESVEVVFEPFVPRFTTEAGLQLGRAKLEWTAPRSATGYTVREVLSTGNVEVAALLSETLVPSVGARAGTRILQVRAESPYGDGAWSPSIAVFIPPAEFTVNLPLGDFQRTELGRSIHERGFVVEISPIGNEQSISQYVVKPQYDGARWNDVLLLTATQEFPLDAQIHVYDTHDLPKVGEFRLDLDPGVERTVDLGPSSERRAYVVDLSPEEGAGIAQGASIDFYGVRPVFDGSQWRDVLSITAPKSGGPLKVTASVYDAAALPVVLEEQIELSTGALWTIPIGLSSLDRGLVAEIDPLDPVSADFFIVPITPRQDPDVSVDWVDVLQMATGRASNPINVRVRVYAFE